MLWRRRPGYAWWRMKTRDGRNCHWKVPSTRLGTLRAIRDRTLLARTLDGPWTDATRYEEVQNRLQLRTSLYQDLAQPTLLPSQPEIPASKPISTTADQSALPHHGYASDRHATHDACWPGAYPYVRLSARSCCLSGLEQRQTCYSALPGCRNPPHCMFIGITPPTPSSLRSELSEVQVTAWPVSSVGSLYSTLCMAPELRLP